MSPLHDASRAGNTELVKQLLDDGAPVDEKDTLGNTALMDAVRSRSSHTMEVVELLLDSGASPNKKNKNGWTALMMAAKCDYMDMVKLLLDKGASPDEKVGEDSMTVLMDKYDTWLSKQLQVAIDEDDVELMHLLLEQGATVQGTEFDENTKVIALQTLSQFDEDQLGRMAAALVRRHSMKGQGEEKKAEAKVKAAAKARVEAEAAAAAAEEVTHVEEAARSAHKQLVEVNLNPA